MPARHKKTAGHTDGLEELVPVREIQLMAGFFRLLSEKSGRKGLLKFPDKGGCRW